MGWLLQLLHHLCVGELETGDGEHDLCRRHDDELRQEPHDVHSVLLSDLVGHEFLK